MAEDRLIQAVAEGNVGAVAAELDGDLAASVVAASKAIAGVLDATKAELAAQLHDGGVDAKVWVRDEPPQHHIVYATVADATTARRAEVVLAAHGYEPWDELRGGSRRSFDRHASRIVMSRTTTVTTVVRIDWQASVPATRLGRLLQPTTIEWRSHDLPARAWWLYPALRGATLARTRLGRPTSPPASSGPFLVTPDSLIDPLLERAGVGPGTRFVDVGCGDGRLVEAAARRGAFATGVETVPSLAARAQRRITEAGLADQAEIVSGRATDLSFGEFDIVFMFLPSGIVRGLLPFVLDGLGGGGRVIVHEQVPLVTREAPARSELVVSDDAITVAHVWFATESG